MKKKEEELVPVKTVTSPSSAPQVTFRQAIRGLSNENGLCLACVALEREGKGSLRCERNAPRAQNPLSLPFQTPATQARNMLSKTHGTC